MVQGINKEEGFTLVEILVAITITTIVLGLVSSIFIFVNQQYLKGDSNLKFYNNMHIVHTKLFNDLRYADDISVTDTTIVLRHKTKVNVYTISEKRLMLNSAELKSEKIDSLYIRSFKLDEEKNLAEWELLQKQGAKELSIKSAMFLRKPNLWNTTNPLSSSSGE